MSLDIFNRLPASSQQRNERKLIVFQVGELQCALDIMVVREILNPLGILPMPHAPGYILGVADHREAMVPIIDMQRRLGISAVDRQGRKCKWVVVGIEHRSVALQVDRVIGVLGVDSRQKRERHPLSDSEDTSWVRNVYGGEAALLFELDLFSIVDKSEISAERILPQDGGNQ